MHYTNIKKYTFQVLKPATDLFGFLKQGFVEIFVDFDTFFDETSTEPSYKAIGRSLVESYAKQAEISISQFAICYSLDFPEGEVFILSLKINAIMSEIGLRNELCFVLPRIEEVPLRLDASNTNTDIDSSYRFYTEDFVNLSDQVRIFDPHDTKIRNVMVDLLFVPRSVSQPSIKISKTYKVQPN